MALRQRNPINNNNPAENDDNDRDEFIATFDLNILSSSSPILTRNDIKKLDRNGYSDSIVRKYFRNSNPHNIDMRIVQIWQVHNVRDYARFMDQDFDKVDNRLLWHGTTRSNLVSILQNRLRLPVVATNGHMFGPGIYFADRMSKSANYTDQSGPEVFLLCQVALGRKYRVTSPEQFTSAPDEFDTIKARGQYIPDNTGEKMLGKYCKVPCGPTIENPDSIARNSTPLLCNEYIVFDQDRIRIKFIVHCERSPPANPQVNNPNSNNFYIWLIFIAIFLILFEKYRILTDSNI